VQDVQRLELLAEDRLARRVHPVLQDGRVDIAEIDFEFQVAWYWPGTGDPRGGKRYFGHYAEVIKTEGRLALCAIRVAGSLKTRVNVWVDLSSPDDCDAGPGSLTHLSLEGNVASGSLFLGQAIYDPTAPLVGPKIPKLYGE